MSGKKLTEDSIKEDQKTYKRLWAAQRNASIREDKEKFLEQFKDHPLFEKVKPTLTQGFQITRLTNDQVIKLLNGYLLLEKQDNEQS